MKTLTLPPAAGQAAHTPTPWHAAHQDYADASAFEIRAGRAKGHYDDVPGALVATVPIHRRAESAANAAFIVRACNSHAALVGALEDLLIAAETAPHAAKSFHAGAINNARAALTVAKE